MFIAMFITLFNFKSYTQMVKKNQILARTNSKIHFLIQTFQTPKLTNPRIQKRSQFPTFVTYYIPYTIPTFLRLFFPDQGPTATFPRYRQQASQLSTPCTLKTTRNNNIRRGNQHVYTNHPAIPQVINRVDSRRLVHIYIYIYIYRGCSIRSL